MSPAPYYLNSDKLFQILSNWYRNPEGDSDLGPRHLSLLEFDLAYTTRPPQLDPCRACPSHFFKDGKF